MSRPHRSKKWLIVGMASMFLLAAVFWMYAISGFSLAFVPCNGTFSLSASLARCRWPVIFGGLFWFCVAAGAGFGVAALVRALSNRHGR